MLKSGGQVRVPHKFLAGFTIMVRPSVTKDNPMQLRYQIQIITKDQRLVQPSSGPSEHYSPGVEPRNISILASHHRFGTTEDANMLQTPLRFDVIINWALSETNCSQLGCPALDPRQRHSEVFNRSVSLKSGEFLNPKYVCSIFGCSMTKGDIYPIFRMRE